MDMIAAWVESIDMAMAEALPAVRIGNLPIRERIRKLVLFNSHGGQANVMDIVARDLRTEHELQLRGTDAGVQVEVADDLVRVADRVGDRWRFDRRRVGERDGDPAGESLGPPVTGVCSVVMSQLLFATAV